MKKVSLFFAVAALCFIAACAKKEVPENPSVSGNVFYIHADGDVNTKAEIDGTSAAFTWSAGDQIAVYTSDGYKKSIALTEGGSASASFAFDEDIDDARADFALFPASLVFDGDTPRGCASEHTADELDIVVPDSYTLAQVQGDASPVYMVAANAPGDPLAFKQMGALLRIKVQYIPKDAQTLKVTFPGQKVQGLFALFDFAAGDGIPAEDGDEDTITITDLGISEFTDALIINIPVPCGVDAKYVRVGAYDSTDHKINSIDVPIKEVESVPTAWKPARKAARKVVASLPYFTSNGKTKKKVVFAPGNLQATILTVATSSSTVGSASSWRFAEHQYDALGDCSGNKFENIGDDIDLFAWIGNSATQTFEDDQKYGVIWPVANSSTPPAARFGEVQGEYIKYDWGSLFNGTTYPADTWRLPNGDKEEDDTYTEWERLINKRSYTYICAKATIKANNSETIIARGLVVFPDTFALPYGFSTTTNGGELQGYAKDASTGTHYADNIMTLAMWELLEEKGGCAFLPVTSDRIRSSGANTSTNVGDAAYWANYSSADDVRYAIALISSDANLCTSSLNGSSKTQIVAKRNVNRSCGLAVRLIRDVN